MKVEDLAKVAHTANKALCELHGDFSQPSWEDAPQWQRESAISGVKHHLTDCFLSPETSHQIWLDEKRENGWEYGSVKDAAKKTHPCMLPYDNLPEYQKAKDFLFSGICDSLKSFIEEEEQLIAHLSII